jgi:hypothetical protein
MNRAILNRAILVLIIIVIIAAVALFITQANKKKKVEDDVAASLLAYTEAFNTDQEDQLTEDQLTEDQVENPVDTSEDQAVNSGIIRENPVDTSGTTINENSVSTTGVPVDAFGGGILQSNLTTGSIAGDITANIGIGVAVDVLKNRLLKKAGQKLGTRLIFRSNLRIVNSAGKVLTKLVAKRPDLLVKMGAKMGKGASKLVGKMAGKAAGSAATKGAMSALKGASPLIIFDAISLIMDLVDVGGYGNMTSKRAYQEMRRQAEEMLKEELANMNPPMNYPIVMSPIGEILSDEDLLLEELDKYMTENFNEPVDSEIKKMFDTMDADIESGDIKSDDDYFELMDLSVVVDNMLDIKCIDLGGVLADGKCNYTGAVSCEERNTWPMSEDSETVYSEFDKNTKQCILAGSSERVLCESKGLVYNLEERACELTEVYCQTKAAEFVDGDCVIPTEQAILGLIFGDTIVNGLKQVFSMDQYEECPYFGEISVGEGNAKTCLNVTNDGAVTSVLCTDKLVQQFFYVPRTKTIHAMGKDNWIFTVKTENDVKVGDKIELKKISEDKITDLQKWDYDDETKQFTNNKLALSVSGSELSMQTSNNSGSQKFNIDKTSDTAFTCNIQDFGNVSACPDGYNASSDLNLDCSIDKPIRKADCYTVYKGPLKSVSGKTVTGGDFMYDNKSNIFSTETDQCLTAESNSSGAKVTLKTKTSNNFKQRWIYNWKTKAIWTEDNKFVIGITGDGTLILQKYKEGKTNQQFNIKKWKESSYTNNGLTCGAGGFASSTVKDKNGANKSHVVGDCPFGTLNTGSSCLGSFHRGDGYLKGMWPLENCCMEYGDDDEKDGRGTNKCQGSNDKYMSRNCEEWGGIVYPKCKSLMTNNYDKLEKNTRTRTDKPYDDLDNWRGVSNSCAYSKDPAEVSVCPSSHPDNGTGDNGTLRGLCYTNCEKLYGPGWYNNGTQCALATDIKGMDSMSCFADEYRDANGSCSKICPEGDIDMGILGTCMAANEKMVCDDTQFISGSRCYTEPPPMFSHLGGGVVMAKRRIVPYSNPDN